MRLLISIFLVALLSCQESVNSRCVQGRYITDYCEGVVIQILDQTPLGQAWTDPSGQGCPNCVVASLDTLVFKGSPTSFFPVGKTPFYFKYRDGGYPQKAYALCNPAPSITVTALSETVCR